MGSIFKPKIPPPPPIIMPEPAKVKEEVSYEDDERDEQVEKDMKAVEKKRRGRRSTILTGPQGLTNIDEENIDNKTLLGS